MIDVLRGILISAILLVGALSGHAQIAAIDQMYGFAGFKLGVDTNFYRSQSIYSKESLTTDLETTVVTYNYQREIEIAGYKFSVDFTYLNNQLHRIFISTSTSTPIDLTEVLSQKLGKPDQIGDEPGVFGQDRRIKTWKGERAELKYSMNDSLLGAGYLSWISVQRH